LEAIDETDGRFRILTFKMDTSALQAHFAEFLTDKIHIATAFTDPKPEIANREQCSSLPESVSY
jgi:hypothetical protein